VVVATAADDDFVVVVVADMHEYTAQVVGEVLNVNPDVQLGFKRDLGPG